MKYIILSILLFLFKPVYSQVDATSFDYKEILLNYYSIQHLQSVPSYEDSCIYLYAQISHPTDEDGTSYNIGDKIYTSKKQKELLWCAKINTWGDTLFTKIISDIPEFRMLLATLVKKDVIYFIVSNTYQLGNRTSNGCVFISYDHRTGKLFSQQVYADPYDFKSFFIKDDMNFYLIVNDVPHLCSPPEYNIYLLQLNNTGRVVSKTLLDKTICMRGEYSPSFIYINKNKKQFYITDASLFKNHVQVNDDCDLSLFDVYTNSTIPYTSYKRYISFFDLKTGMKKKRISFSCNKYILGFLNDTDFVSINTNLIKSDEVSFVFENLKKSYYKTLQVKTYSWHTTKMINNNLFVFGFASDTVNIKRIRNNTLLSDKNYIFSNYKPQYGNEITPVFLEGKIRYYYIRQTTDSIQEISYFDESIN